MKIRALVIDDEIAAVGNLLHETGQVEVVGEYTIAREALDHIGTTNPDVVFLDIEMPGLHGMELANRILDFSNEIQIVFVTAYNEYALEAFELNATDYLLKPVTMVRLAKTLKRVQPEN